MKRRFVMWMTIVCILVVGVSVTRMTRDFVVSKGVETAAIVNVMDVGNITAAAAGAAEKAVITEQKADEADLRNQEAEKRTEAPQETLAQAGPRAIGEGGTAGTSVPEAVSETEPQPVAAALEEVEDTGAEPENLLEISEDAEMASGELGLEPEDAVEETEPESASSSQVSGSPKAPIDTTRMDAIQETVKSPLDPLIEKSVVSETEEETVSYTAEDFFERFAETEQNALKLWENVTFDNRNAYYAAAEQERALWDYELNQVYNIIRSKLSLEEAEDLKVLELEWLKERDLYAEKAAAKSAMKNAYNQNPEYAKALAEKTKERCYWLVSEYEDVLNRETGKE